MKTWKKAGGPGRQRQGGFTLVEIAVVLGIIAVILGAVSVGTGVLAHARAQRLQTDFIWAWSNAFKQYVEVTHHAPGDNGAVPQNQVVSSDGTGVLCNDPGNAANPYELSNEFLKNSIPIPQGHGTGEEANYVYQDGDGAPGQLQVCFRTVPWAVQAQSVGTFETTPMHVMEIRGLSLELARQLDAMIDDRVDARFGAMRSPDYAAQTDGTSQDWPGATPTTKLTAYLLVGG